LGEVLFIVFLVLEEGGLALLLGMVRVSEVVSQVRDVIFNVLDLLLGVSPSVLVEFSSLSL